MALRPLRPSDSPVPEGHHLPNKPPTPAPASASASASPSVSASTSAPEPEQISTTTTTTGKRKRKQVLAACSNCRKQKSKCDGKRPTCATCLSRKKECHYAVPEGLSVRAEQRRRLNSVSEGYENLRTVFDILRRSDEGEITHVVKRIRDAPSADAAIEMISDTGLLVSRLNDTGSSSSPASRNTSPGLEDLLRRRFLGQRFGPSRIGFRDAYAAGAFGGSFQASGLDDFFINVRMPCLPVSKWTDVIEDDHQLTHLMNLFWTWDNTTSRLIDREIFIEDLMKGPAAAEFCSSFMVNALLALACTYSTQEKVFGVPGDLFSRGQAFATEAARLFKLESREPSLPLFQGTALLWVYEAITGDGAFALRLLDDASKQYTLFQFHTVHETDVLVAGLEERRRLQAKSHMAWGYYCVVSKIELTFSKLMRNGPPSIPRPVFGSGVDSFSNLSSSGSSWFAYPISLEEQEFSFQTLFLAECELAVLTEDIMAFREKHPMSAPTPETLEGIEKIWQKLAQWRTLLPMSLQPYNSSVPSVLILQITYSSNVLKLVEGVPSTPGRTVGGQGLEALRISHATSIMSTIWTFRAAYTFHHEYWAMQSCFAAAIAVLEYLEPGSIQVDTFVKACQALSEMGQYLSFANSLLAAIQSIISRCQIALPLYGSKYISESTGKRADAFTSNIKVSARLPGRKRQDSNADEMVGEGDHLEVKFSDLILLPGSPKVEVD